MFCRAERGMTKSFGNVRCGYAFAQQGSSSRMTGNIGGNLCFDTQPSRNPLHVGIDATDGVMGFQMYSFGGHRFVKNSKNIVFFQSFLISPSFDDDHHTKMSAAVHQNRVN